MKISVLTGEESLPGCSVKNITEQESILRRLFYIEAVILQKSISIFAAAVFNNFIFNYLMTQISPVSLSLPLFCFFQRPTTINKTTNTLGNKMYFCCFPYGANAKRQVERGSEK